MLDDRELKRMKADIQGTFPDYCAILNVTNVPDGAGGWTETWGTVLVRVPCRLDANQGNMGFQGAAMQPTYSYTLSLPADTMIDAGDRVEIKGMLFEVSSVGNGKSWEIVRRAALERI